MIFDIFEELKQWREDRNISGYDHKTQVSNLYEELLELVGYDDTDYLVERFMGNEYIDDMEPTDSEKIDALCDIIVFSINAIEGLGYNADECLHETFKEINSRKQDPKQVKAWSLGHKKGKWQKNVNQDKNTLYKADYDKCRK